MQEINCHAILFDMDGVLVDSTAHVERHWQTWARKHALDFSSIMSISHGQRAIDTMREVARGLDLELERETLLFEKGQAEDLEGLRAFPGAMELVKALPEESWAIVTSATLPMALARLRASGLPFPRVLVTAEEVHRGKPHPEGYLKAAQLLGIAPSDCLVIEDAPAGIQAARSGALRVLALTTTFPAEKVQAADFVTEGLHTLHLSVSHVQEEGRPELRLRIGLQGNRETPFI